MMIKKILFALLAFVMLQNAVYAQGKNDQHTTTTRMADLLAQLPANDAAQLEQNMKELSEMGEDSYVALINGLTAPGKGNNALIEYAVGGFSAYVTKPGQEAIRKMCISAYCKALAKLSDNQNKAFIISQFDLVGNDEAVPCLQDYLTDEQLADVASRALVKINTSSSVSALLNGLSKAQGKAKLSVVEALGHTDSKEAARAINTLIANSNDNDLVKVGLFSLAHIADESSEGVFAAAAEKNGFKYENTDAVASYLLYAQRLAQYEPMQFMSVKDGQVKAPNKELAIKIAKDILQKVKADDLVDVRIAALKIAAEQDKQYLLAAMADKQFEYRAAALKFALAGVNDSNSGVWVKKLGKADGPTQVLIIDMLVHVNAKSALPAFVKLFKSKDQPVRAAAIAAAGKVGEEQALDDLLKIMNKKDTADVVNVSDAILRMKGNGVMTKVAAFIPKAEPEVQVALINVLALRSANAQLITVSDLLKNKDPEVRKAAYASLKHIVTNENKAQLFTLLNETSEPAELADVQDAIIASVKGAPDKDEQIETVLRQMESAGADKKILYYKVLGGIGGSKSLKAVADAFGKGDELTRKAALNALSSWADAGSAEELIKIARATENADFLNQAVQGYLRIVRNTDYTAEERLLLLRNAMDVAKTTEQQLQIVKDAEQSKCFNAIVFAGKYLDNPALQQAAANTVMNITLAGEYNGDLVKDLLNKAIAVITGGDAGYQKEGMRKYISQMKPGKGFVSVFNGKDLTGWKGLVADPVKRSKMDAKTLAEAQEKADTQMLDSWKVVNGELRFMSHGDNLATVKKYGDFEMLVDWKIIDDKKGEGDAGIYPRGTPQVQIWDNSRTNVGAQVGSGGLYNNQVNESKPLMVADNKLDEWNTFRILMKGDRVTVYLNGQLVTDNVILENYWDKNLPIFAEEQIELQAHGSPVAYRDIYIREIPAVKPFELSAEEKKEGYKILFDGTNMYNWTGNTTDYIIKDGNMAIEPKPGKGSGGNLYTKEEFSDFIFRFEFQLTPGANNGLGIRAPLEGDAAYVGMELQILDNEAPMYKDLHVYQYHGSVYGTIPAKRGFLKPVGEWNYEEVVVKGPKIKVILNGTVILDGDITDARKNGAPDGQKHPGLQRESGHIGFLGHGSPLQFRNIRIKDLSKKK